MRWPGSRVMPVSVQDELPSSVNVFEATCFAGGAEAASCDADVAGADCAFPRAELNGAHNVKSKSGERKKEGNFMASSILVWATWYS